MGWEDRGKKTHVVLVGADELSLSHPAHTNSQLTQSKIIKINKQFLEILLSGPTREVSTLFSLFLALSHPLPLSFQSLPGSSQQENPQNPREGGAETVMSQCCSQNETCVKPVRTQERSAAALGTQAKKNTTSSCTTTTTTTLQSDTGGVALMLTHCSLWVCERQLRFQTSTKV